jgi:anti-anti-sigma regulatory factor
MAMRRTGAPAELDRLTGGEHVGWMVKERSQFRELAARCLVQGALMGEKPFLFEPGQGSRSGLPRRLPDRSSIATIDPSLEFFGADGLNAQAMYRVVRRQAALASEQGYRGLRVLADMNWLLDMGLAGRDIARFEQGLDEVAADTGATIVCAYRWQSKRAADLAEVMSVHPHGLGTVPQDLGFRIWTSGADRWHLAGQVDLRSAQAFPAALATAAEGRDRLRLECAGLDFIDVGGIRAIARLASGTTVRITVEAAGETLRRCWKLTGWDSELQNVEFYA